MPYHPFSDIHFMIFSGLLFLPSPKSGLHKSELKKPDGKIVLVSNLACVVLNKFIINIIHVKSGNYHHRYNQHCYHHRHH